MEKLQRVNIRLHDDVAWTGIRCRREIKGLDIPPRHIGCERDRYIRRGRRRRSFVVHCVHSRLEHGEEFAKDGLARVILLAKRYRRVISRVSDVLL